MNSKIIAILQKLSGTNQIREDNLLEADLGLDSLGMVTLLMEMENAFQIELKESDLNPFDLLYVSDVIDLVNRYHPGEHL